MASPLLLPGNRFRAYRAAPATPTQFIFLCLAQSITLTLTNEYEDATVPDCDNPLSTPNRKSVIRSRSWGGRVAGAMDAQRFVTLREDTGSDVPINYQFMMDRTSALGGGTWTGAIFIENLEITKQNGGMVNWTAQFRGDDALTWAGIA